MIYIYEYIMLFINNVYIYNAIVEMATYIYMYISGQKKLGNTQLMI